MLSIRFVCVVVFACLCSLKTSAELLPIEAFSKRVEYQQPKISPTGKYIATIIPVNNQDSLVIIDLAAMQVSSILRFNRNTDVLRFDWVSEDRVICSFGKKISGRGEIVYTAGELYAMDADGGRKEAVFGYRAGAGAGTRTSTRVRKKEPINAYGEIIDVLRDDEKHVLVAGYHFSQSREVFPVIYRLDVYSGTTKQLLRSPIRNAGFLTDRDGVVRVAVGRDRDFRVVAQYRADDRSEWVPLDDLSTSEVTRRPVAMHESEDKIYVIESKYGAAYGLSLYDPATGESESVWGNQENDVTGILWSGARDQAVGVSYYDDKLRYIFFAKAHVAARMMASIQSAFKDQEIKVTSQTWDGKVAVIRVGSGSAPAEYFLFDTETKNLTYLFGSREWLDPGQMASVEYFSIESRDGLPLHGYLTKPLGSDGLNLPLVVLPHGGPHGVRDEFRFNPDAQLLANRGYAVLQVNFRGSGGYGPEFERLGYRQWGGAVQNDIGDATQWAIEQGVADPERICIVGASFGAYSALMSVVREPDMYQCAVGLVGIYDLPLMYKRGDIQETNIGEGYLRMAIGTDDAVLEQQSPAFHANAITANIFIAYGKRDERAPPAQSASMIKALETAGKSYQVYVARDEGHGFNNEATRAEWYTRLLVFLDENIGATVVASSP